MGGIRWHDSGALVWTWPLSIGVAVAGSVVFGVSFVLPPSADGLAEVLGPVGVTAIIVAVAGRLSSAQKEAYAGVELPAVPACMPGEARAPRARSVGRPSVFPWLVVIMGLGALVCLAVQWPSTAERGPVTASMGVCLAIALTGWLVGPIARFVVTPHHLRIDSAFRRVTVPRRLLADFSSRDVDVRLRLTDGRRVYFRVDSPLWDVRGDSYRSNRRTQVRVLKRIVRLMERVPAAGSSAEDLKVERRPGGIALAVGTAVLFVGSIVALAITASQSPH